MTDHSFRQAQRSYEGNKTDTTAAANYIRQLEKRLGITKETPTEKRVNAFDPVFPCLLCEKGLKRDPTTADLDQDGVIRRGWVYARETDPRICMENAEGGVSIASNGNWGSRVVDGNQIFFYICDECIVRHSNKMLYLPDDPFSAVLGYPEGTAGNARDAFETWTSKFVKETLQEE